MTSVRVRVWNNIIDIVENRVGGRVSSNVRDHLWYRVFDNVDDRVYDRIALIVHNAIWDGMRER